MEAGNCAGKVAGSCVDGAAYTERWERPDAETMAGFDDCTEVPGIGSQNLERRTKARRIHA